MRATMTNTAAVVFAAMVMFLQGCGAAAARNPVDLRPLIAVSSVVAMLEPGPTPIPSPVPAPAPKPGDSCEPCRGTGKLGDGTAAGTVTCVSCGGTGIVPGPKQAAVVSASPARQVVTAQPPPSAPPPAAFRIICEDGKCRRVYIQEQR